MKESLLAVLALLGERFIGFKDRQRREKWPRPKATSKVPWEEVWDLFSCARAKAKLPATHRLLQLLHL